MHCGFECPGEIAKQRLVIPYLDNVAMAPAFASLNSPEPAIGAILVTGLGQRREKAEMLCDLLERVPADSSIAQACVQALGFLGDCGDRFVRLLEAQLNAPGHYHPAWIALLRNGSDGAIDALLRRLTEAYDHALAINLLHRPRVTAEVARLMRNHLTAENIPQPFSDMAFQELTVYVDNETLLSNVLHDDEIQEYLRKSATDTEGGIWYTGAKAAAIRGLSVSDREEAYETALAALRNPQAHDRERYPEILMRLDENRAIVDLFEQMSLEQATAVQWAIGRALGQSDLSPLLDLKFQSKNKRERLTACWIAGFQPDNSR